MNIENKEQMTALLKLAGYVEIPILEAAQDYYDLDYPVYKHNSLPPISLAWVNGCQISGIEFFTFDQAWSYIQGLNHDNPKNTQRSA